MSGQSHFPKAILGVMEPICLLEFAKGCRSPEVCSKRVRKAEVCMNSTALTVFNFLGLGLLWHFPNFPEILARMEGYLGSP